MIVTRVRIFFAALALGGTLYVGGRSVGPLPPLGPFLNPATGVWSVARAAVLPAEFTGVVGGLGSDVEIVYDRRGVPHIRASTVEDAARALGYVVARDRLFQLEIQSRAPEGTLTELLGAAVLDLDRQQRAIGLSWSAERDEAAWDRESRDVRVTQAYADGVNAWIDAMTAADLPFEYHLLGLAPRRWEPLHTALVGKRMGYTLAYDNQDLWRLRVEALVGKEAADALFPVNSPIVEPIQPNGSNRVRFEFTEPPPPSGFDSATVRAAHLIDAEVFDAVRPIDVASPGELGVGSNNWAVSGARSESGRALLSGDPHLDLTLPSIWYEVHLSVPGEVDVYGVTIPGIPVVLIGFNRDVAWSSTNTGADVLDYYRESFDDDVSPSRYLVDGEWRPLERRVETFHDPAGVLLDTDTVLYTHRGPVSRDSNGPLSMRWTILDQSASIEPFLNARRASNVREWLAAMAPYSGPAQNNIVADGDGNIAIRSMGLFPIRPDDGNGLAIRDGSTSQSDWLGFWPLDRYPFAINPTQGFLASANQQPVDRRVDDSYLGANWPHGPWRAMRINRLLRADSQVTAEAMRRYQTDPGNEKAELFVPAFIEAARGNEGLDEARRLLEDWDRRYTKDNERALLFELAFAELVDRTWDELVAPGRNDRVRTPTEAVLAGLLRYPQNRWWDDRHTTDVSETRDDVLNASLQAALQRAKLEYGDLRDGGWRWSEVRHANVYHLLRFEALSALDLAIQGGSGNLNPSSDDGRHGASWRMVVELGDDIRAWTTYPGGQSGNPASRWYVDRIDRWVRGELEEVLFPRNPGDLSAADVAGRLTLRPAER